jgi:hypothetical protein
MAIERAVPRQLYRQAVAIGPHNKVRVCAPQLWRGPLRPAGWVSEYGSSSHRRAVDELRAGWRGTAQWFTVGAFLARQIRVP